ncbi:MAG: anaerobic ribonucleoside-triphosphate reductase activating protein [Candidatus Margulisbacteria bacterium]|jgi:pyruvate formate lyase activating enzyme|nr:anaerobic ribonucleoside-triphosphate reductase activating protein [Candidatus Margulisiibacteriota bacterium]
MPVIKGLQKTTLVDYPGKIAATIFTAGCNFRCVFCHNTLLVKNNQADGLPVIDENELLEYLRGRTRQLDGICISGGEPTLHADLPEFIRKIKEIGYAVKLDTNGTNPEMLEKLLRENLLDYAAMDIKGPLELYPRIANTEVDTAKISRSIDLLRQSGIPYEFRTTVLPAFLAEKEFASMASLLNGTECYYLQQFHAGEHLLNPEYSHAGAYTSGQLNLFARQFEPFVKKVAVRGA